MLTGDRHVQGADLRAGDCYWAAAGTVRDVTFTAGGCCFLLHTWKYWHRGRTSTRTHIADNCGMILCSSPSGAKVATTRRCIRHGTGMQDGSRTTPFGTGPGVG
jgi:hypothetical protein